MLGYVYIDWNFFANLIRNNLAVGIHCAVQHTFCCKNRALYAVNYLHFQCCTNGAITVCLNELPLNPLCRLLMDR
jgi:hypothetical protein